MLNWKQTGFIIAFSFVLICFADVTTSLASRRIIVGNRSQLLLSSDTGDFPEFVELPRIPGLHWIEISRSRQRSTVNFSVTRQQSISIYGFYVDKPGRYVIPSSPLKVGRRRAKSGEIVFEAIPARSSYGNSRSYDREEDEERDSSRREDVSSLLFARFRVDGSRKIFYAGETIPIVLDAYLSAGLRVQIRQYPEIKGSSNLVFGDWRKENPENPKFRKVKEDRVRAGGKIYNLVTFRTAVQVFQPGPLTLDAEFPVMVMVREESRHRPSFDIMDDDFFDVSSFFARERPERRVLKAKIDGITIRPLPENRTGTPDLGITGKWMIVPSLSAVQCRAGEAVTLKLELNGTGNTEMLKAPALEFPGFRTYPPEIERNGSGAVIRYILIPTEPGQREVTLKVAFFDTETGTYRVTSFRKMIAVSEARGISGRAGESRVVDTPVPDIQEDAGPSAQEKRSPTDVLYLKKPPFRGVTLPLWKNSIVLQCILVLAGILFWVVCEFVSFRKRRAVNDPDHQRKAAAGKERRKLLSGIKALPPERIPELSGRILACINDLSSLPAGSTLDETASALEKRNPDLADSLKSLGVSSWAPGGGSFTQEKKQALMKGLARLGVLLIAFLPLSLAGASDAGSAMNAYDSGKTGEALAWYRSLDGNGAPSPEILYNIGNCLYRQKQYAPALAAYEKARKLRPRDRDILENLNLIRRTLHLPEKYLLNAPGDVPVRIRDLFRPDEWMTFCAAGILLIFIGLGLRRFSGKGIVLSLLCGGALLVLGSLSFVLWQNETSYASDQAIVTGGNTVSMVELPAAGSRRIRDVRLSPGEEVQVIEMRPEWVRIRAGAVEGWVRENEITLF